MLPTDQKKIMRELIFIDSFPSIEALKDEIRSKIKKYKKLNCEFSELIIQGSAIFILFKSKN